MAVLNQLRKFGRFADGSAITTNIACGNDQYITSFSGTASQLLNSIGARCSGGEESAGSAGGSLGTPYLLTCPGGFDAVRALDVEIGMLAHLRSGGGF